MRLPRHTAVLAMLSLALGFGATAQAQVSPFGPSPGGFRPGGITGNTGVAQSFSTPVYSPYLNLLRSGGSFTQNYYGLVRPEIDFRNAATNLQSQINQNDQSISSFANPNNQGNLLFTGHSATFLNTRGYFLTLQPSGSGYRAGGSQGIGGGNYGASAPNNARGGVPTMQLPNAGGGAPR